MKIQLISLICLCSTINCFQTELLCRNSTFYFEDMTHSYSSPLINAFYRLELNKNLSRFKSHLIELDSEFADFLRANSSDKLLGHIEKYNRVVMDVLSEKTGKGICIIYVEFK